MGVISALELPHGVAAAVRTREWMRVLKHGGACCHFGQQMKQNLFSCVLRCLVFVVVVVSVHLIISVPRYVNLLTIEKNMDNNNDNNNNNNNDHSSSNIPENDVNSSVPEERSQIESSEPTQAPLEDDDNGGDNGVGGSAQESNGGQPLNQPQQQQQQEHQQEQEQQQQRPQQGEVVHVSATIQTDEAMQNVHNVVHADVRAEPIDASSRTMTPPASYPIAAVIPITEPTTTTTNEQPQQPQQLAPGTAEAAAAATTFQMVSSQRPQHVSMDIELTPATETDAAGQQQQQWVVYPDHGRAAQQCSKRRLVCIGIGVFISLLVGAGTTVAVALDRELASPPTPSVATLPPFLSPPPLPPFLSPPSLPPVNDTDNDDNDNDDDDGDENGLALWTIETNGYVNATPIANLLNNTLSIRQCDEYCAAVTNGTHIVAAVVERRQQQPRPRRDCFCFRNNVACLVPAGQLRGTALASSLNRIPPMC